MTKGIEMLVNLRYFDLEGTFVRYFYRDRYKFESFDLEKLVYLNGGGNCVIVLEDIHWVCMKKCDEITWFGEKLVLDIVLRKSYFLNLSFENYLC